jgi:hypothetical protein
VQLAIPIAPLIFLPFILIAFVVVFPIWVLALAVVGLLLLLAIALDFVLVRLRLAERARLSPPLRRAFRWVITFGGLARPRQRAA